MGKTACERMPPVPDALGLPAWLWLAEQKVKANMNPQNRVNEVLVIFMARNYSSRRACF